MGGGGVRLNPSNPPGLCIGLHCLLVVSSASVHLHLALCCRYCDDGDVIGEGGLDRKCSQLFSEMAAEAVAVNQATGQIQVIAAESGSGGTGSPQTQDGASATGTDAVDNGMLCLY